MTQAIQKWKVGTRASALAVRQTELFLQSWKQKHPHIEFELKKIVTSGDTIQDRFLAKVGGKGLFLKEIEEALLKSDIDLAIHSLKDVPTQLPQGLKIVCYPKRESPWDILVSLQGLSLEKLKHQSVVGTSSLRRRAQLLKLRPDIRIQLLRGNIQTRLKKLQAGEYDAIVLAEAGIQRMGLKHLKYHRLPLVPAAGQGALAIEAHSQNEELEKSLQSVHCSITQEQVEMERHVMRRLGGNCSVPLGVHAQRVNGSWELEAFLGTPHAERFLNYQLRGNDSKSLAEEMIILLIENGAEEILQASEKWMNSEE